MATTPMIVVPMMRSSISNVSLSVIIPLISVHSSETYHDPGLL